MADSIGLKVSVCDIDVYVSLNEFKSRAISNIFNMKLTGSGFKEGEDRGAGTYFLASIEGAPLCAYTGWYRQML